ncbi:MAG: SHOCT domain-containing protein [Deltaproteobacteria bacterium]|nr:SHOCT domain-containing protein [Deltaproteobacteria bacterium]
MGKNGGPGDRWFSNLAGLTAGLKARLGAEVWRRLHSDLALREHQDTLRRLLSGDFSGLTPQQRQHRVEQIISASAMAAMGLAVVPIPFLELPVLAAMVQAIARVHGVKAPARRVLWRLLASLGGGLALRQGLRFIPLAGSLPLVSRVYGTTWALGHTANILYASEAALPREALRRQFEETLNSRTATQARRMAETDFPRRFQELAKLRSAGLITEEEFQRKRRELLDQL